MPIPIWGAPKSPVRGFVHAFGLHFSSSCTSSPGRGLILCHCYTPFALCLHRLNDNGPETAHKRNGTPHSKSTSRASTNPIYLERFCRLLIRLYQTPDISSSSQGQPAEVIEFRGLPTLQNWCYVNSVFQAFLHAPKFVNWLTQDHANCAIEECLGCALRDLSTSYWTDPLDWHALEIAHFMLRRALRKSFSRFSVQLAWRNF